VAQRPEMRSHERLISTKCGRSIIGCYSLISTVIGLSLSLDSNYYGLGYLVRGIATEVRRVGRRVDCLACLYDLCPDAFNLERLFSIDDVCDLMAVRMHMQGQPESRLPRRCKDNDFLTRKVVQICLQNLLRLVLRSWSMNELGLCIELAHAVAKVELVTGDCRTNPKVSECADGHCTNYNAENEDNRYLEKVHGSNEKEISHGRVSWQAH
jgi:hypothetical protein